MFFFVNSAFDSSSWLKLIQLRPFTLFQILYSFCHWSRDLRTHQNDERVKIDSLAALKLRRTLCPGKISVWHVGWCTHNKNEHIALALSNGPRLLKLKLVKNHNRSVSVFIAILGPASAGRRFRVSIFYKKFSQTAKWALHVASKQAPVSLAGNRNLMLFATLLGFSANIVRFIRFYFTIKSSAA